MKNSFKNDTKVMRSISECTTYCKCGHSIAMSARHSKEICNVCGRTVYNQSYARFKKGLNDLLNGNNNSNISYNN